MENETWESIALPIMRTIAEEERGAGRPSFDRVVESVGQDRKNVERETRQLVNAHYVGGIDTTSMAGFDMIELHLHEKGKVAIGEWPGGDAYRTFIELVERRIDEETDPENKRRFRRLLDALTAMGTSAGGDLLAAFIRSIGS